MRDRLLQSVDEFNRGFRIYLKRGKLAYLAAQRNRTVSKHQILAAVWGYEAYDPNLVEVYVSGLRRKLEAHGPRIVHTVRGLGYTLRPAT